MDWSIRGINAIRKINQYNSVVKLIELHLQSANNPSIAFAYNPVPSPNNFLGNTIVLESDCFIPLNKVSTEVYNNELSVARLVRLVVCLADLSTAHQL